METLSVLTPAQLIILLLILMWSMVWKGLALWRSARNNHKVWFVILLLVNTVGILEIIYLILIDKQHAKVIEQA
jgi:methionyl-tRNA synthetase